MRHPIAHPPRMVIAVLLLIGLLCASCQSPTPAAPAQPKPESNVLPDTSVQGRVVSVNSALRYAVMDFLLRPLPALDQRLQVYRDGQKVGEVRVSGPFMGTTAAGDIVAGQVAVGDEVRED